MSKKIEILGNFLKITDTVTGLIEYEKSAQLSEFRNTEGDSTFYLYSEGNSFAGQYEWTDLIDSTNTPYASKLAFVTWKDSNTGISKSSGGGASGGLTNAELRATPLAVVLNDSQTTTTYTFTGAIALNTDILTIDCEDVASISVQCSSMGTAGVVTPQWSNDNINYPSNSAGLTTAQGAQVTTFTTPTLAVCSVYGRYLRLRVTTAVTGGTTTFVVQSLHNQNNFPTYNQSVGGTISVASLSAATNSTGAVLPVAIACPATPVGQSVKASAGRVLDISVCNTNATLFRYLKFYNATSVVMGTTASFFEIAIPPNQSVNISSLIGIGFSSRILIAVTGGKGLLDNTAVTLNDVVGFVTYS